MARVRVRTSCFISSEVQYKPTRQKDRRPTSPFTSAPKLAFKKKKSRAAASGILLYYTSRKTVYENAYKNAIQSCKDKEKKRQRLTISSITSSAKEQHDEGAAVQSCLVLFVLQKQSYWCPERSHPQYQIVNTHWVDQEETNDCSFPRHCVCFDLWRKLTITTRTASRVGEPNDQCAVPSSISERFYGRQRWFLPLNNEDYDPNVQNTV